MKTRTWLCLTLLLLGAAAPGEDMAAERPPSAAVPEYKPPAQAPMFQALWARRRIFQNSRYRFFVVQVLSPKSTKGLSGTKTLKLRAVADLSGGGKDFKPMEVSVQVSLNTSRPLASEHDRPYYLASIYNYTRRNKKMWRMNTVYNYRTTAGGRTTYKNYYLVPVEAPDGPLATMIRALLLGRTASGKSVDGFELMLKYAAHENAQIRRFAASYASVNGWDYSAAKGQAAQPDTFAKAILAAKDATIRGLLAGAYRTAKADLLPRDPALLTKIFHHSDPNVYTPALHDNLRHASKRSADVAGLIREVLKASGARANSRPAVLAALAEWGEPALALGPELEAVARGAKPLSATREERIVALRALLAAKTPNAADLTLATLADVPSAVALEHAVDAKSYAVAARIIRAGRGKGLEITPAHLAALSLLTRRFPGGDFSEFDAWWAKIEKAGRAKAMIDAGFVDPAERAEARKLIAELGSGVYRQRRDARRRLSKMGTLVLPALVSATTHRDPAVAAAAENLVRDAEATFKKCRDALAAEAKKERGGNTPLISADGAILQLRK